MAKKETGYRIEPSPEIDLPAELMPDALIRISAIAIPEQVQKIMTYRQHNPYFNNPWQKLSLWFGHFTNLIYTCFEETKKKIED